MGLNLKIKRKYFALYIGCCTGLVFGLGKIVEYQENSISIFYSMIAGTLIGLLVGFISYSFVDFFMRWKIYDEPPPLPLPNDETLLKVVAASHNRYFSDCGWLYLTNKNLYFRINKSLYFPHQWKKYEKKEITIPLEDVIDTKLFSMGIFQLGIKIKKDNGKNEIFRTENEEEWRESILDIITKNKMGVST